MRSIALIINEFGEIGLDNLLVETAIENTLLLGEWVYLLFGTR